MASPQTDYIVEILLKVWEQQNRLRSAMARRKELEVAIKVGGKDSLPEHLRARYQSLEEAAQLIGNFVATVVEGFNRAHPDDMFLTSDLDNVLEVVRVRFGVTKK